jgi:hypothetical protein
MTVRRIVTTGAAALAGCGVLGMVPAAAQAGSASGPHWTRQHPAAHPPGRSYPAMAYDTATGTVVLFGGQPRSHGTPAHDTWTWNGTTWTQQHPATSPGSSSGGAMAYDTATGTMVLFGGNRGDVRRSTQRYTTWTWDGTTWTRQSPAVHPPARGNAAMAYDAATGTAVLFGGYRNGHALGDTWTWDGTTWTKQAPATSPGARYAAAMAYDTATGTAVLFGGENGSHALLSDTWTWDGTTWTQQATAPDMPRRAEAAMAYDAATGTTVLFGGEGGGTRRPYQLPSTWTWG